MAHTFRYLALRHRSYGLHVSSEDWGHFTAFVEIEDQLARRQVNVFESGRLLRYDRSHWCDDFGFLFLGLFSRKEKAAGTDGTFISAGEFERQWRLAVQGGMWDEQLARSRQAEWGTWTARVSS